MDESGKEEIIRRRVREKGRAGEGREGEERRKGQESEGRKRRGQWMRSGSEGEREKIGAGE